MSTRSSRTRPIAIGAGLLLATGLLTTLPVTPLGRPQAAEAAVTAGDIVYVQQPDATNENQIRQVHSGTAANITSLSGNYDSNPDVSPDGSRIVFSGDRPCADNSSYTCAAIVEMNADGSNEATILPGFSSSPYSTYLYPVWSPDGTKIAYTLCQNGACNIAWSNADGTGGAVLTTNNASYFPSWSPNGSTIAYESDSGTYGQIYVVNTSGTPSPHLVAGSDDGNIDLQPAWSPTGDRLYFRSYQWSSSTQGIWYYTSTDNWATTGNVSMHHLGGAFANSGTETIKVNAAGTLVTYTGSDGVSACPQVFTVETGVGSTTAGTTHQITSTGCSDWNSAPTFVPADWTMNYNAVLGDSYSSGESNSPYISPSGTDGCHRSLDAYAEVLQNSLPVGMSLSSGGFVACSGASSGDVISGYHGEDGQLGAISSSDKFLILTIGGNDVGFSDFVAACVSNQCAEGSDAYNNAEGAIADALPSNLATLFDEIAATVSTGTRVLVLGYPKILPVTGGSVLCDGMLSADQTGANQVEDDLNSAIQT